MTEEPATTDRQSGSIDSTAEQRAKGDCLAAFLDDVAANGLPPG